MNEAQLIEDIVTTRPLPRHNRHVLYVRCQSHQAGQTGYTRLQIRSCDVFELVRGLFF